MNRFDRLPIAVANERGFSLVELIVVIAIMATVIAISIPAMSRWQRDATFKSDARSLLGAMQFARVEAVKRNGFCSVLFDTVADPDGRITYTVFVDDDNDRILDAGEEVLLTDVTDNAVPDPDVANPVSFSDPGSGTRAAIFNGRGMPMNQTFGNSFITGTLRLQGPTGIERQVAVSSAGRIRISIPGP